MPNQLANPPLVEALLEIRWKLTQIAPDTYRDPAYRLLVGQLYERIRDRFGFANELPIAQIPDEMTAYMVKQQFRAEQNGWPLVQIGPGIATLNFASPYSWDSFQQAAQFVFPNLGEAYAHILNYPPREEMQITSVLLRYINAVDLDWSEHDVLQFLESKLHTIFELPKGIAMAETIDGVPIILNLQIGYPLKSPKGKGIIRLASGHKDQRPSVIWELMVRSENEYAPQLTKLDGLLTWLKAAHDVIEKWFFEFIEGDLLQQFKEQPK